MSSGSKNATTTTKQELDPAMREYLMGQNGAMSNAQHLYSQGTAQYYPGKTNADMNDVQYGALNNQLNAFNSQDSKDAASAYKNAGQYGMQPIGTDVGRYDLGPTATIDLGGLGGGNGSHTGVSYAPQSSGGGSQFAGYHEDPNNPTLQKAVDSASQRLTDNFNASVLPAIDGGAQAAGQFGSSRHGIAEGLAAKGLAQSMGDMTGNMYSQSYEGAQNRNLQGSNAALSANSAGNVAGIGAASAANVAGINASTSMNINGANNLLQGAQFNAGQINNAKLNAANLGFTAANTRSGLTTDNMNRMITGAGAMNNGAQMPIQNAQGAFNIGSTLQGQQQNDINSDRGIWDYYSQAPQQNLNNYYGLLNGGIGDTSGRSQTGANPNYTSPAQGAIGGAAAGASLAGMFGGAGAAAGAASGAASGSVVPGWGTAIGAIGGGLLGYMGSR